MNDQQNIKQLQQADNRTRRTIKIGRCNVERTVCDKREEEWKEIRSKMEAGSGATGINISTIFRPEASILQELKKELQSQGDALAEYETQDWQDEGEWITQGWCEALEFAIKTIERRNKNV